MRLDCGIPQARLRAWLDDELALERDGDSWQFRWQGATCRIELSPLDCRTVGSMTLERTELAIEGDAAAVEEASRQFTLRFVSAGG